MIFTDADAACSIAAVFTTNRVRAAPVKLSQRHLADAAGRCRGVVVNAGNANCCTGAPGDADAAAMARRLAEKLGAPPEQILVCSTGIIGERLPMNKILNGIDAAYASARAATGDFAAAILTTDLVTKTAAAAGSLDGRPFKLAGVAKGSGMIAPRMATMLAFVTTDVQIEPPRFQRLLGDVTAETFNRITVDGDTSTNDTVIAMASGRAAAVVTDENEADFRDALLDVCLSLARQIARDGEGASHFVTVQVRGAAGAEDADRVGRAVAESLLVKTAIAGNDPNWGRILVAAGRSGAAVDEATFSLKINGLELFRRGAPLPSPSTEAVQAMFAPHDILVEIDLGQGEAAADWHTCDLTHGYITINADYHT